MIRQVCLNTNKNILFQRCFSFLYVLMEFHPFLAYGHNLRQEKAYSTSTLRSDQLTHGIAPECEFTYQAFKTPKVNLSGMSPKRATNQNFIKFLK